MNHVNCGVHVVGDHDSDEKHVDIYERVDVPRPKLTAYQHSVVPVETVNYLQHCHALNRPQDELLKTSGLVVEEPLVDLIVEQYNGK